jgi:2-polyprenyl-3-methyl-5-hydroxy-6-metoxy-1,4-benzoquinol methylase
MTTPRHKYEYHVNADTAAAKVIGMVGAGKRVLELGPGPGSITRHLKDNGCRITALEMDKQAIEIAAAFCEHVHPCNLNNADWPDLLAGSGKFAVIVAADVLEHLYDPWTTLQQMHRFLAEDGYVVISLPHVAHSAILACLLNEDFAYRSWGLLDRTHIRFWGMKNMQKLFEEAGFKIIEADFVLKAPEQTEFADSWRRLPSDTRQALAWNRFGNVYQVVLKAVPRAAAGEGLQLELQPVAAPVADGFVVRALNNRILVYLASFLGRSTRDRISRLLQRLGIRH